MPDDTSPTPKLPRRSKLASYVPGSDAGIESDFDEYTYLRAFPDVARAVERGELASGLQHYLRSGRAEHRLQTDEYVNQKALDSTIGGSSIARANELQAPATSIEAFAITDCGAMFLVGWTNDRHNQLVAISAGSAESASRDWTQFCRLRRTDVEAVVQSSAPYHYGFWVFTGPQDRSYRHTINVDTEWRIELRFANGAVMVIPRAPIVHADAELRDSVMTYFAGSGYFGNRWMESFGNLDHGAGDALVVFNRSISRAITVAATAERFGQQRKRFKGSIIVPLFGIGDYLFLQACAYAYGAGIEDYEFIYVVNSPELIDQLRREARIAEMIYGLAQTLVFQSGNAGFGAANNVAVQFAQSDRLLFVNPDVFPQQRNWAQLHSDLIASLPAQQTRLFGSTLCYDDGSLMHGGMYFDVDVGVQSSQAGIAHRNLIRVEHYGKGAPLWAKQFSESRPVPAVTGAFLSIERAWFEKLGGFTEDYMYGHYEDADLCLKSLQSGVPAWLHDLRLWHLEGKGSKRLPQHEGGSLLNRWLFSRTWEATIIPELVGRTLRRPLPRTLPAEAAAPAQQAEPQQSGKLPATPAKRTAGPPARARRR